MADRPCTIGDRITIRGNLTGSEDLVVQGRVEGSIALTKRLTVAPGGIVAAEIQVEDLTVNGGVTGEVEAIRSVVIAAGARIAGNVRTPRLVIEDGARFKGQVVMDVPLPEGVTDEAERGVNAVRRPRASHEGD